MAVEGGDDRGRHLAVVLLEVDKASRKDKDFPFLDGLGDQDVGGGYEPNVQLALEHEHHLGGTWVGMGWVQAPGGVVDARERDAEGVEARDLFDVGSSHERSHRVVG